MCYTIPLAASVGASVIWGFRKKSRKRPEVWWLNLFLYGGALFGIVDHLWHGELFLISQNWANDLALGGVITAVIFAGWGIILTLSRKSASLARYLSAPKLKEAE